jgi:hypothetical protein
MFNDSRYYSFTTVCVQDRTNLPTETNNLNGVIEVEFVSIIQYSRLVECSIHLKLLVECRKEDGVTKVTNYIIRDVTVGFKTAVVCVLKKCIRKKRFTHSMSMLQYQFDQMSCWLEDLLVGLDDGNNFIDCVR